MTRWTVPLWFDRLGGLAWRFLAVVAALAVLVLAMAALSSVVVPALLGVLFAAGLSPLHSRLRRLGVSNALSACTSVLLLGFGLGAVVWLIVDVVVDQWPEIAALIDAGRQQLEAAATDAGLTVATSDALSSDVDRAVSSIVRPLLEGIWQLLPTVASTIAVLLLSAVAGYFFLKDGAAMWRWTVVRFGSAEPVVERIGARVWSSVTSFVRGQAAIAVIDAAGITIGAVVLSVPKPAAIFLLAFIGAFVPFIGAFMSGLVAVMLALGSGGVGLGAGMLAIVVVVQVIEGNVLQPWIQGRAVRLHPLVVAAAVTAGGATAGFLGVLLAVPLTASVVVMVSEMRSAERAAECVPAARQHC